LSSYGKNTRFAVHDNEIWDSVRSKNGEELGDSDLREESTAGRTRNVCSTQNLFSGKVNYRREKMRYKSAQTFQYDALLKILPFLQLGDFHNGC